MQKLASFEQKFVVSTGMTVNSRYTVVAIEALIKYCINSFLHMDEDRTGGGGLCHVSQAEKLTHHTDI